MRSDYDTDPERFRAGVEAVARYGTTGDVHVDVAKRLVREGLEPTLDLGCGEGRLGVHFPLGHRLVSLDHSPVMLKKAPGARTRGDGTRLPFRSASFGSVAALWCLYHFDEPRAAIRETFRVLYRGGLFVACTGARDSDPELAHLLKPQPSPFDAEEAARIVGDVFGEVEVERWDGKFVTLPDEAAVALFLRGRGFSEADARDAARTVQTPLALTKRGCLVWAYRCWGR